MKISACLRIKVSKVRVRKARGGADLLDGAQGDVGSEGNVPRQRRSWLVARSRRPASPWDRNGYARVAVASRFEFQPMGAERRAAYMTQERTIYARLDRPQVIAARGAGSSDDVAFRGLVCEIAFTEYAIALRLGVGSSRRVYRADESNIRKKRNH
jgi:hypothetical protein